MTAEERAAGSETIRRRIREWPAFQNARTVMMFCPLPVEPDLLPLMTAPESAGKRFIFPLTHPDFSMTLHEVSSPEHLVKHRTFVREPDPALCPRVAADALDAVLVPGLAFTPDGHRLGRGAGYYDRFLAALPPRAALAGVAFACQLTPSLPVEPHDHPLPRVIAG